MVCTLHASAELCQAESRQRAKRCVCGTTAFKNVSIIRFLCMQVLQRIIDHTGAHPEDNICDITLIC